MNSPEREGRSFHKLSAPFLDRRQEGRLGGMLLFLNVLVWGGFLLLSGGEGAILEIGLLAFLLGVRHGFDADHIAVIDNLTRRLPPSSNASRSIGLMFASGHSLVVILSNLALILFFRPYQGVLGRLAHVGSWMGTLVSAGFLSFIGLVNVLMVVGMVKQIRKRKKNTLRASDLSMGGLPGFLLPVRPPESYRGVFLVGVFFGLSFDTSAEIALLLMALSIQLPGPHHLFVLALVPALFAAGMISVDTIDGVLMARAYHWAMKDFNRTLLYNLTLTGLSVFVAWGVGALEWMRLIRGGDLFKTLSFSRLGSGILAGFMLLWATMVLFRFYKSRSVKGMSG